MKHIRFGQTHGTAHQESRRLNKADLSAGVQKIEETGGGQQIAVGRFKDNPRQLGKG
jgi:hypothetical protein